MVTLIPTQVQKMNSKTTNYYTHWHTIPASPSANKTPFPEKQPVDYLPFCLGAMIALLLFSIFLAVYLSDNTEPAATITVFGSFTATALLAGAADWACVASLKKLQP